MDTDPKARPSKRRRLSKNHDSTAFKNVRCAEDETDNEILWELTPQISQRSSGSSLSTSEAVQNSVAVEKRMGGLTFNDAVSYVNKIKVNGMILPSMSKNSDQINALIHSLGTVYA